MNGRECLKALAVDGPVVLPSLLLCDFTNLRDECQRLKDAGFRALHLDVMDGVFVPNLSYGLTIVEAIRKVTDLPLDVHLMIADPGKYAKQFREAGADVITFAASGCYGWCFCSQPVVWFDNRRGHSQGD